MSQHRLRCEQLFDGLHWHSPGYVEIEGGIITSAGAEPLASVTEHVSGITLPGMANLHSHAFQRALAGLTEQRQRTASTGDSFWSWRELMYRFVSRLSPDDVQSIAEQAYVEMLEAGYTSVAEFHYLHHDPTGIPYADLGELSRRVTGAARNVGLRMTLLPVYYEAGGFGAKPIADNQRRFYNTRDRYLSLVDAVAQEQDTLISLGMAPHSLRAVPLDGLAHVVEAVSRARPRSVIHMHIAEQRREVDECLAHHGVRPVELLFREQPVDARWCLVHATHLTEREVTMLAGSRAVAGLCPTTEANLGDGIFPLREYVRQGGRWGIGSDSQVTIAVTEELRLLEYGQRLVSESRNTLLDPHPCQAPTQSTLHSGTILFREAQVSGAQALGAEVGGLRTGACADLVVLDPDHPSQLARQGDDGLDSWIFASNRPAIARVMVNGTWVVEDGAHRKRHAVQSRFGATLHRLLSGL